MHCAVMLQLPCSSSQHTMLAQGFKQDFTVLQSTLLLKLLPLLFNIALLIWCDMCWDIPRCLVWATYCPVPVMGTAAKPILSK